MRLLVDRNVERQYIDAFRRIEWITVRRASDVLPIDAPDSEIGTYAEAKEWVVFTSDKRFRSADSGGETAGRIEADCGVVYYHQLERPSPTDVVEALEKISNAYVNHREIDEYVPGEWD